MTITITKLLEHLVKYRATSIYVTIGAISYELCAISYEMCAISYKICAISYEMYAHDQPDFFKIDS